MQFCSADSVVLGGPAIAASPLTQLGGGVTNIKWKQLDEDTFNELVEALLVAEYTGNGLKAQAIDGRGGDDGIDVDVRVEATGQITHIFQLKHFPEGFSGGFVKRRSQIKESFKAALKESPPVWTLVVPRNPTIAERKAVFAMASGIRSVRVRIFGPAELDGLLSKYPKIESYFKRKEAIEVLREVNRAEAALAKPGDLQAEVMRLKDRLDGRSQYWGTALALEPGGTYVETIYAKRDDAPEREPLSITMQAEFGPGDENLRERFEDKMKYGGSGTLVLPADIIKEIRRDGPEWFQETSESAEVHISASAEHESRSVRAELYDGDDVLLAQLSGTTKAIDRGYAGGSVETSLRGGLDLRWRFSDRFDEGGSVTLNFDPAGASGREVRQALRFVDGLKAGIQVRLTIADSPALKVNLARDANLGPRAELRELVEDLCYIEDQLDLTLYFPTEGADLSDRLWARVVVRILRGEPTPIPFVDSLTGTLTGTRDSGLDLLLNEGVAVCATHQDWVIEMFGQTVHLGGIYIYSHHVETSNPDVIRAALDAGTAAGMKLEVTPVDGGPFLIYAPRLLGADPDAVVLAHPWELTGVAEHPQLEALPNFMPRADALGGR